MNTVSIVIVSWNAKSYVEDCLNSLKSCHAEIIVVDNASSDGTPEMILRTFPEVTLIQNPENAGFAKANNLGIARAAGDYVCLVNSDVIVPDGCIERMVEYMAANPAIGLLGPRMTDANGTTRRSTMRYPTLWNSFCRAVALDSLFKKSRIFGGFLARDFAHDRILDVDILNGWFWMTRREALERVGLLDERFFIYGEDIDWCRRFQQAGWRVVFNPDSAAIHFGGASSDAAPIRFYIEMQRANLQYWEKHHGRLAKAGFALTILIHHTIRMAGYLLVSVCVLSKRGQAWFKVRRSAASILWLSGIGNGK